MRRSGSSRKQRSVPHNNGESAVGRNYSFYTLNEYITWLAMSKNCCFADFTDVLSFFPFYSEKIVVNTLEATPYNSYNL